MVTARDESLHYGRLPAITRPYVCQVCSPITRIITIIIIVVETVFLRLFRIGYPKEKTTHPPPSGRRTNNNKDNEDVFSSGPASDVGDTSLFVTVANVDGRSGSRRIYLSSYTSFRIYLRLLADSRKCA